MSVSDPSGTILQNCQTGTILGCELELFYVQNVSGTTVTVVPGYLGSTSANHSAGALVYLNPRFSFYDVQTAINDDLSDLCSPENGLYAVGSLEITYNPAQIAYDLPGVTGLIDIISVQYNVPYPINYWVPMTRGRDWLLNPTSDTTDFASGYALRLLGGRQLPYPGLPMRVVYKQTFAPFVNLTDDATTVAGLSSTMTDLPPLGAMVALVAPHEVRRNEIDSEPDSRRGNEVPPGAVMNSIAQVLALASDASTPRRRGSNSFTGARSANGPRVPTRRTVLPRHLRHLNIGAGAVRRVDRRPSVHDRHHVRVRSS